MTDRCEVCGAPEEHFDAAPCVEYLKKRLAEFTVLVTVKPGTVSEDVNALRNLLRKSMYLTREANERCERLEARCAKLVSLGRDAADSLRDSIEAFAPLLEYCRNSGADPQMLDRAAAVMGNDDGRHH